jgi:hypothetical protein
MNQISVVDRMIFNDSFFGSEFSKILIFFLSNLMNKLDYFREFVNLSFLFVVSTWIKFKFISCFKNSMIPVDVNFVTFSGEWVRKYDITFSRLKVDGKFYSWISKKLKF